MDGHQPASGVRRWTTMVWVVVSLLLVAVLAIRFVVPHRPDTRVLPVMGTVPSFSLIDQSGESFSWQQLRGRVWLASFIYTTCPGPCPLIVQRIAEVDRRLSHDPRVTIVSFSVDPEADTPKVLAAYARNHGISAPHWRLLTGDSEQLYALIRKGFLLGVERTQDAEAARPDEGLVMHSTRLVLIDAQMQVRGYYDSDDALAMRKLAEDTSRLVNIGKP